MDVRGGSNDDFSDRSSTVSISLSSLPTFITEPVGLLPTAVLTAPAEHLEVVSLLLGYHHQH